MSLIRSIWRSPTVTVSPGHSFDNIFSTPDLTYTSSADPTSNDNFSTLVPASDFPELEPGHECYSVPNPPSDINAGSSATLQLSYISESDTDANQTFYACADIIYVELSSFTTSVPCFNVSVDDPTITSSAVAGGSATATSTSALGSTSSSSSHSSHNNDLSGGAIAGTVIGSVAGAALVVGGIFVLWRRYAHKVKRNKAVELRMNELTNPTKSTASSDAA